MKTYKITENEKPIATQAITAYVGMGIFEIRYAVDDKIKVAWLYENERSAYRWLKIRYDVEGDAYIFMDGERRYLKDFY